MFCVVLRCGTEFHNPESRFQRETHNLSTLTFLFIRYTIISVCNADRITKYPTHSGIPKKTGSTLPHAQKSMASRNIPKKKPDIPVV